MRRPADWLRQAERDLAAARSSMDAGHHEWACFASQQAAEKAAKAIHEAAGVEAWGHSVRALLEGLEEVPDELIDAGRSLDRHYIPARYPNAYPEGAPGDHYSQADARQAIDHAGAIIDHARSRLP